MNEIEYKAKVGAPVQYTFEKMQPIVENWLIYAEKQTFSKTIYDQKLSEQRTIELKKPLTIQSFILYAKMHKQTFYDIINDKESNVYDRKLIDLFTRVQDLIQQNQIEGAILNEYNGNIVSRINGLTETVQVDTNVTLNSLPLHIGNQVIDLTSADYTILNNSVNDSALQLTEKM